MICVRRVIMVMTKYDDKGRKAKLQHGRRRGRLKRKRKEGKLKLKVE